MKGFKDIYINKDERFSIGFDEGSNRYYISIPVSNRMVDYEEYYVLPKDTALSYDNNIEDILCIVKKCRDRKNDEHLFFKPGKDRGIPS